MYVWYPDVFHVVTPLRPSRGVDVPWYPRVDDPPVFLPPVALHRAVALHPRDDD